MSRGKRFSFTLNNPTCLIGELYHPTIMSYIVAGEELAPSTGTVHFQGYLETHSKKSVGPLAKELETLWKGHPHLIVSKGTAEQNKAYCHKDNGTHIEHGSPMQQGARTDLSCVTDAIASGSTMKDLWKSFPKEMIKYHGGIKQAYLHLSPNMNQSALKTYSILSFGPMMPSLEITESLKTHSVILWGESGTRKTSYARALLPKALFVSHMDDLALYDQGEHDGIIFDDMAFTHLPRESQIHIFDMEQPRSLHIRYNTAQIPAGTKKIFTTNNQSGFIYLAGDKAIERRIKKFEIKLQMPLFEELGVEW